MEIICGEESTGAQIVLLTVMENKEQLVDLIREGFRTQLKDPCGSCIPLDSATWFGAILSIPTNQMIKQSINKIHYYLYWSRMRTP